MLSHLCRRFHASLVMTLLPSHYNSIRTTCRSTVRLLVVDSSAQPLLQPAVHRFERCVGIKTYATPQAEEKLRRKDGLSSDYSLIYRAPMLTYIQLTQGVCIGCTILYSAFFIAECISGVSFSEFKDNYSGLTADNYDKLLFLVSFCALNGLLYSFTSKYALRIYRCKDGTYKSIFLGVFPWSTKKLSFKKGEITAKPSLYFLPWKDSQYRIGSKKAIILDQYFRRPADFNNMFKT